MQVASWRRARRYRHLLTAIGIEWDALPDCALVDATPTLCELLQSLAKSVVHAVSLLTAISIQSGTRCRTANLDACDISFW
jgi:hypothetical protein